MEAMKKNYLELGQNSHVKSAYVEFVQSVVEFLQQHTHDICPVDQFFTDSSAFPLPATDPTYVVGRLKSYVPKLSEQRTLKQLVSFLQNVSERAAVDNEQAYLASQLRTATTGTFERGDTSKPTLRQVLLGAIFPAYIEPIFKTTAGWILAKPLLQASRPILEELNYQHCQYSVTDPGSVAIVEAILSTMLDALYNATELLITHSGLLEQPHILHTLSLLTAAVTATVLPASHLYRRTGRAAAAVQRIDAFKAFSLFAASTLLGTAAADAFSPYPPTDPDPLPAATAGQLPWLSDVRQLCARDLAQALGGGAWGKQDERYFLARKSGQRTIVTAVGTLEEEKRSVVRAIEEFHAVLGVALWRGEEDLAEKKRRGKERSWPRKGGELCMI
ncbi:Methyl methanesulfonate-sensitivity protein 22 [Neofusicoccum parvum]|uniref:Putative methyl methanesulfonate-sensitivity protein 22 protein n=1 Tax=Botryosphaeria parva (strain UCR-NP2) TaxID=1287680 RepID=R1H256_BOTPV|nr:putative methyl methanesulfonate-sensitivity protein 22 protein [Neofusicoccum parvum UCRNP2]GME49131.1 Methyl methanesulfonate-sensitivity protein 22 [Neofusicoccum parvum]